MKNILAILFLFTELNLFCQKNVTLYFRNGDSLKVISHLTAGNSKIKYRENEGEKKTTVDYRKVKKAKQQYNAFSVFYTFKIKKGHTVPILLQQVKTGTMYLYKTDFTRNSNFGSGLSMSSNHSEYYVCKNDMDIVTTFNASGVFIENGFRKKSRILFKDRPLLLKKINNKTWKMKDIPKIIDFYNQNCSSN